MTDLEQRIRQVLSDDAQQAPRVERAPETVRPRVRQRQTFTGLVAGLTLLVVSVASVAAIRALAPSARTQPAQRTTSVRTSTIQGVSITYPTDWYLVALDQTTSDWADRQPHSAFRPVLQLTNFDPVDVQAGRNWFCPVDLGGSIPDGGSVMYVEAIGGPIAEGAPSWPVPFPATGGNVRSGGGCAAGVDAGLDTRWTADGIAYHAVVLGDANDPAIGAAFGSMTFSGGTPAVPGNVDVGPIEGPAYVVDSMRGDLGPVNLLAQQQRRPALGLETAGMPVTWEQEPWSRLTPSQPVATYFGNEGVGTNEVFGPVGPSVERLELWLDDGRSRPVPLDALPPSFRGLRAFATRTPSDLGSTLVALGEDGSVLAAVDAGGASPDVAIRDTGISSRTAADGSTWWVTAAPHGTALQLRIWSAPSDAAATASVVASATGIPDPSRLVALSVDPFAPGAAASRSVVVGLVPDGSASIELAGQGRRVDLSPEGFVHLSVGRTLFVGAIDATSGTVRAFDPNGSVLAEDRFG
ncbi:MAG: hypothetical protein ACM3OO_03700 [Planctomycetaceae bacterium]